ncbi:MAG TPA: polyhydroxybutyrate depolymerase, partial [Rhodospirillales bacterium]|nr:polyhydroxybutyrate depolymerase [Rhodospirillales bacterium]
MGVRRGMATALAVGWLTWGGAAAAGDSPCPATALCATGRGEYGLLLPAGHRPGDRVGVVLFFHGWGSSAEKVLGNRKIREAVLGRGYALLAPQGLPGPESGNRGWSHQGSPHRNRDEVAFLRSVVADAVRRAPLDRDRILVSGFSAGGSMVWHLACYDRARYRAFAPIAGAFWEPLPEDCEAGPVRLLHLQGFADRVVPIEGRAIGDRWQ